MSKVTARQAWRELLAADKAKRKVRARRTASPEDRLKADLISMSKRTQFEEALERASEACNRRCTCRQPSW